MHFEKITSLRVNRPPAWRQAARGQPAVRLVEASNFVSIRRRELEFAALPVSLQSA